MTLDDAMMQSWSAPDGWPLRCIRIAGQSVTRGSLLFLGGRADHIEKYDEALLGWAAQGWTVESVDWRGQGGSGRLIPGSALGHAEDFTRWLDDIEAYGRDWRARTEGPHVIVAHSMGAHLVLRALAEGRLNADAVTLSAPMLGIHTGMLPHSLAVRITALACALGSGQKAVWPSHRRTPGVKEIIQTNLTHCVERFEREAQFELDRPDIVLDAPTWGWLRAAYRSLKVMDQPGYLERVTTPLLILASEGDRVVSTPAIVRMAERLPDAQMHIYGTDVAHEILREVDAVRDDALARIDRFFCRACTRRMTSRASHYDVVIVGAGMAGASLGAELAGSMSVLVVEMEEQPGYHATGRSVAFWSESYGGPHVRPLTLASHAFLSKPEADFAERSFLTSRGALHIGRETDGPLRDALVTEFADTQLFSPCAPAELQAAILGLREDWAIGLAEPSTCDIDVAALHAAYLRKLRSNDGVIACGHRFEGAHALTEGGWSVRLSNGEEVRAGLLINAAGAWADPVARASGVSPSGIVPLLRTVVQLRVDPAVPDNLPLVLDLSGSFYFKPVGGGRIWLTPHDERPVAAGDVAPEEEDIAIAIERLQAVVDWRIEAVERKWAGLRSFAPDRLPIYGYAPDAPGFFWFAGQGGFGIQTAPAAAKLGAALILGREEPSVDPLDSEIYSPARF